MTAFFRRYGRYLISAGALSGLVYYVGPAKLLESLKLADAPWTIVFFLTYAMVPVIYGVQIWVALHLLGHHLPVRLGVSASVNAWCVGMLTPARAGDLTLAYFLSRTVPASDTVALVAINKILSLIVLSGLAVASGVAINLVNSKLVIVGASVAVVAVLSVVLASRMPNAPRPLLQLGRRALGGLPEDTYESFRAFAARPVFLGWATFAVSFRWMFICGNTWVGFRALNQAPDFIHVIAATTVGRLLALLPISIGGVGLKEPVQIPIYATQGVPAEAVVALSVLGLTIAFVLAAAFPLLLPVRAPSLAHSKARL